MKPHDTGGTPGLIHTRCPIDNSDDADVEVYRANFDLAKIDVNLFSARRIPDRIHYRMVLNTRTGCMRADPILPEGVILQLYRQSKVTYESIADDALANYAKSAEALWTLLPDYRGVLEIGCGPGYFLETMRKLGFRRVAGVEPSADAVAKAGPAVKDDIHQGRLTPGLFAPESFSLICGFQVLDHLVNPNEVLQTCMKLLVPAGVMFWVCHDIGFWTARLLGRRCPMIDIEHVVLYNKRSIASLFMNNGFIVQSVFGVRNTYPLQYWIRLAPLPGIVKDAILKLSEKTKLGRLKLRANLGNMGIIALKPS